MTAVLVQVGCRHDTLGGFTLHARLRNAQVGPCSGSFAGDESAESESDSEASGSSGCMPRRKKNRRSAMMDSDES